MFQFLLLFIIVIHDIAVFVIFRVAHLQKVATFLIVFQGEKGLREKGNLQVSFRNDLKL